MVATVPATELNEEQLMLRDMAREFSRKEIAPNAEHYDRANEFPMPIFKKAAEIGLTTIKHPGGIRRRWRICAGREPRHHRTGLGMLRHLDRADHQ